MSDAPDRSRRRTAAPGAPKAPPAQDQEELFGDLSGIARDAVRSPADPRLDTHLAFLGLSESPADDPPADDAPAEESPGIPVLVPEPSATPAMATPASAVVGATPADGAKTTSQSEVDQLRTAVARLQTASAETADRLRQLTFVIGVLAIATVVALIIGIVR